MMGAGEGSKILVCGASLAGPAVGLLATMRSSSSGRPKFVEAIQSPRGRCAKRISILPRWQLIPANSESERQRNERLRSGGMLVAPAERKRAVHYTIKIKD